MSSHNRSARVREGFKSSKPYAIRRRLRSGNFVVVHSAVAAADAAAPKEERKLPILPVEPINLHSDSDEEEEPSDDASAFIAPIPAVTAAVEEVNGNGGEECEVDPQYMAVLAHLREDGRSYVLDIPDGGDGKPVFIKYEAVVNGGCGHEEVLPSEAEENGIENMEEEDELVDPDYVDFKNHLKVEDGWMVLEWEGFDPVVYERLDVMEIESGGDDDDDDEDEDGEFDFEKELKAELERPYDHDEYEEKMKAANCALPQERLRHLRSGSRSYPTKNKGYSLLHHYKDLEAQIESADCHTGLVLLRGFFFWLMHVAHDGAYMPWKQRASKDEVVDADML